MGNQMITYDQLKEGDRLLIRRSRLAYTGPVEEATFLELSPGGHFVKLNWLSGLCRWEVVEDYIIVEVLK